MPLTNYSLDNFVSQQLSQLTEFNVSDIANQYSQAKYWVSNFVLNSMLRGSVSEQQRTFIFFFLRRAEAAFSEYVYACQSLNEFLTSTLKKPSLYFRALHHFEMAIAMLWQAYNIIIKVTNNPLFKTGDGSEYARLNGIYNASRHINPSTLSVGQIHVVWLSNEGIQTDKHGISFPEFEKLLCEIGDLADSFSQATNPDD